MLTQKCCGGWHLPQAATTDGITGRCNRRALGASVATPAEARALLGAGE